METIRKYQSHSQTSREAAHQIEASAETLRGAIYRYIISCGSHGATDDEIQRRLSMNPSTQRPRRVELAEKNLIERSESTRRTATGRRAAVWVAVSNPRQGSLL